MSCDRADNSVSGGQQLQNYEKVSSAAVAFEKTLEMNRIHLSNRPMSSMNRNKVQFVTIKKPERVMSAKMLLKNKLQSPTFTQETANKRGIFARKSSP